jgi:hypothetical protein
MYEQFFELEAESEQEMPENTNKLSLTEAGYSRLSVFYVVMEK